MKVIVPENATKNNGVMNYKQKRRMRLGLERMTKKPISKEDFESFLLMQRLKNGKVDDGDLKKMAAAGIAHYDNVEQFPDGTEVMLNYEAINARDKSELTEEYLGWVEENKEKVFHLMREENKQSLVCLEEDVRVKEVDGENVVAPKWLFDLFSDLLVRNDAGEWVEPWSIEESRGEYVDLAKAANDAEEAAVANSGDGDSAKKES